MCYATQVGKFHTDIVVFSSEANYTLFFISFGTNWLRLPGPVSGDQADKSVAAFLEVACFGSIKTVILSPESSIENVLQW
jgi:hypothetical protein